MVLSLPASRSSVIWDVFSDSTPATTFFGCLFTTPCGECLWLGLLAMECWRASVQPIPPVELLAVAGQRKQLALCL